MQPEEIFQRLKSQFNDKIIPIQKDTADFMITISAEAVAEVMEKLRDDPDFVFKSLMCLSGVDAVNTFRVVYHLYSLENNQKIVLNVELPHENPHVPTISHLWRAADWFEREAFDMFGITFDGNRDLRRILCPEDWEGYPLRKNYRGQEFYHGMRVSYPGEYHAES